MSIVSTQGLVLRYTDYKESDRILVLITPKFGKIVATARGARKPKSRLLAASQLFCLADYHFFSMNGIFSMTQADIRESFFDLRRDLDRFAYATYIMNLTEEALLPGEQHYQLYPLVVSTLYLIAQSDLNVQDIVHVFEIKLISLLGYSPILERCSVCSQELTDKVLFFSPQSGGVLCKECCKEDIKIKHQIHLSTVMTLRYMLQMNMDKISILKVSAYMRDELEQILPNYIEYILDKTLKSRKLLPFLNKREEKI